MCKVSELQTVTPFSSIKLFKTSLSKLDFNFRFKVLICKFFGQQKWQHNETKDLIQKKNKCFTFCKPCQPLCTHVFSSQVGFGRCFWLSISISTENYCVTYLISFLLFLPISFKGQSISKGLFKVFICTKKRTKIFLYICPSR